MKSVIKEFLILEYGPVGVWFTDEAPDDALTPRGDKWACVVPLITGAMRGRTTAFSRETVTCMGAAAGLCMGNRYEDWFRFFLSTGVPGKIEGERYKATPELTDDFLDNFPFKDIPQKYVVFKPLDRWDEDSEPAPELVSCYANADQISALVVLAQFGRTGSEHVIAPFGAGCQSVCAIPLAEAEKEVPHAVIGMTDISARPRMPEGQLAFTVTWPMFQEMEAAAPESFLTTHQWEKVRKRL